MSMAYLAEPGAHVHLDGYILHVLKSGRSLARLQLPHLHGLAVIGPAHLTSSALLALLDRHIPLVLLTRTGRLRGYLWPGHSGRIELRRKQFEFHRLPQHRLHAAVKIVAAKIQAMTAILEQAAGQCASPALHHALQYLADTRRNLPAVTAPHRLRGLEGSAARAYWAAFASLNCSPMPFAGRKRRPPTDPLNAMLSLGYTFLACETHALLGATGLDPFLGFYHVPRDQRPALVLDVIEPWRHWLVDRLVLRLANLAILRPADFQVTGNQRCLMTQPAVKRFIDQYEQALLAPPDPPMLRQGLTGPSVRQALAHYVHRLAGFFATHAASDHPPLDSSPQNG